MGGIPGRATVPIGAMTSPSFMGVVVESERSVQAERAATARVAARSLITSSLTHPAAGVFPDHFTQEGQSGWRSRSLPKKFPLASVRRLSFTV